MEPLINILIRTSNRPQSFGRCMQSVRAQTYDNYQVIVSADNDESFEYAAKTGGVALLKVAAGTGPYGYNLYCNLLKAVVCTGWFFFLDDDDVLATPTVLAELAPYLTGNGVLVQFNRGGTLKPATGVIENGQVGMPCLVLPAANRHLADIEAEYNGDYQWIRAVAAQVPLTFHPIVLVKSRWRGHGYKE